MLNQSKWICPSDEAVFLCTRENSPVTTWRLELVNGASKIIGVNSNFEVPGTIITRMLNGVQVRVHVLSGNSTFIHSTLTLSHAGSLNMSRIICNINIITYFLPNSKI